ncbi:MAG: aminotransferase class IV, partial [Phycisphaerales bacterium]
TPPTSEGILQGITRDLAIELARKRGITVMEKRLIRHDLYIADECFATGTAAEVIAIVDIDCRPVGNGKPGPITTQLLNDFIAYRTPR